MNKTLLHGVLTLVIGIAGCEGESSFGGGGAPDSEEGFATGFLESSCRWLTRCDPKLSVLDGIATGLSCRPDLFSAALAQLDNDRIRFDAEAAEACVRQLDAVETCDVAAYSRATHGVCDEVFVALQAVGEPCSTDSECISGECEGTDLACEGVCIATAAEGEVCGAGVDCIDGLSCTEGVCQRSPGGAGDGCRRNRDCGSGLQCASGMCAAAPGVGATCSPPTPFSSDACADDLVCAGVCGAGAAVGESCAMTPCAPGARCHETRLVCIPARLPGESCEALEECPPLNQCRGGRCAPMPVPTEACDSDDVCADSRCVDGTCTQLADGQPCEDGVGCEGFCDDSLAPPTCAPRRGAGEPCDDDGSCELGARCLVDAAGAGTCTSCPRSLRIPGLGS